MVKHHPGQILQVDLVNDSAARRNDPHVPERRRAPLDTTRHSLVKREPLRPAGDLFYLQELESLSVAVKLQLLVLLETVGPLKRHNGDWTLWRTPLCLPTSRFLLPVEVHVDGMIDDQVGRADGIDFGSVSAELLHRVAHGGEVHQSRYAPENHNNNRDYSHRHRKGPDYSSYLFITLNLLCIIILFRLYCLIILCINHI